MKGCRLELGEQGSMHELTAFVCGVHVMSHLCVSPPWHHQAIYSMLLSFSSEETCQRTARPEQGNGPSVKSPRICVALSLGAKHYVLRLVHLLQVGNMGQQHLLHLAQRNGQSIDSCYKLLSESPWSRV